MSMSAIRSIVLVRFDICGNRARISLFLCLLGAFGLFAYYVATTSAETAAPHAVLYTQLPQDQQLFPRNIESNQAVVLVAGTVDSASNSEIIARIYEGEADSTAAGSCDDGVDAYATARQALSFDGQGRADFSLTMNIEAKLVNYQLEICLRAGSTELLERAVEDLVAGDVFLIQGQSNANAHKREESDSAAGNQGPFVRSFGRRVTSFNTADENGNGQSDDLDEIQSDLAWHEAKGDAAQGSGAIGQWGIRLGRRLVDEFGVPVAILNNAVSGTTIEQHQRDDSNPERLDGFRDGGIYGRLLWRTRRAGVAESARALLWYQGESDSGNAAGHLAGFKALYADWGTDYPNLEHIYVHQIRNVGTFCNGHDLAVRDVQRRLVDDPQLAKVRLMSTTAVSPQIEGCHFPYANGYEKIGDNIFRLLAHDLYGQTDERNVEPPHVDFAYFTNNSRNEVGLVMRNELDSLLWNSGAEQDFAFSIGSASVTAGRIDQTATGADQVLLTLNQGVDIGTTIDYLGHPGVNPPDVDTRAEEWVTNANGVGLLAFSGQPIAIDIPAVQITPLSDPLAAQRGVPLQMEISISDADSIAQLAVLVSSEPLFSKSYDANVLIATEQVEWTPTELGAVSIIALARDERNALQRGVTLDVMVVNQEPQASINQPAQNSMFTFGDGQISVDVAAADADGTVAQLALVVNGTVVETLNPDAAAGPWTFMWTAPNAGTHQLSARVTDNDGAVVDSAPVIVNIVEPTPTPVPTATSTATPVPTNTPIPTPTATVPPTATPVATATSVPTATSQQSIYAPIIVGGK